MLATQDHFWQETLPR